MVEPVGGWPRTLTPTDVIFGLFFGRKTNITGAEIAALKMLTASFPEKGSPGVPVPVVELLAHGLLVLSLLCAFLGIAARRRTGKRAVSDSWELLPAVDVAVKLFTAITAGFLIASLLAFVLMFVPVNHTGIFPACIYTGTPPPPSSPCAHRARRIALEAAHESHPHSPLC